MTGLSREALDAVAADFHARDVAVVRGGERRLPTPRSDHLVDFADLPPDVQDLRRRSVQWVLDALTDAGYRVVPAEEAGT